MIKYVTCFIYIFFKEYKKNTKYKNNNYKIIINIKIIC